MLQGSHRLEKYLDIQDCLEKSLKIKFALKSRLESDWIVRTEQPSFSGSLVLSMSAATNLT